MRGNCSPRILAELDVKPALSKYLELLLAPPPPIFRPSVGSDEWTANIRLRDTISLATTIHGDE